MYTFKKIASNAVSRPKQIRPSVQIALALIIILFGFIIEGFAFTTTPFMIGELIFICFWILVGGIKWARKLRARHALLRIPTEFDTDHM